MISWTSSSGRAIAAAIVLLCAATLASGADGGGVALFPPHAPSLRDAPIDRVADFLRESLEAEGFRVLPTADLDRFLERHRVRYTAGIDEETAAALGVETGVSGAILTEIEDWQPGETPRFAMISRFVTADSSASIAWIDGAAFHGEDHPGFLDLGLVHDPEVLLRRACETLAASLRAGSDVASPVERRFRPRTFAFNEARGESTAELPRVAVLPFLTEGPARERGELVALELVRALGNSGTSRVLEPGVVRRALLDARVIQDGGPSLPQVDALRALLQADMVVSGLVSDYEPNGSAPGTPYAGFSARGIDTASRQVVWSSFSFARGDDGVRWFGTGHVRSAPRIVAELARGVAQALVRQRETRSP